jgi:hypothetical protein
MIRRLNFTGRTKIPLKRVSVSLLPATSDRGRAFNAEYDLAGLNLPLDAHVYVEAYYRAQYMRFDSGTVERPVMPAGRELTEIEPGARPLFRVKVVDQSAEFARILAVADKVIPIEESDTDQDRKSLLYVRFLDLGHRIWELDLDCDWPELQLNERIEDRREIARSDEAFQALVYPQVVRQVLTRIIAEGCDDEETDPNDWPSLWLRFACSLPNVRPLPEGTGESAWQQKQAWVDEAVDAFCGHVHTLDKFLALHPPLEGQG